MLLRSRERQSGSCAQESMRSRCLCQICTCGRHHCPHETTRIYDTSGVYCPTTEYLEKYPTYGNVLPAQSLKPKQGFRADGGKMEAMTTFKCDYCPHEIVQQPRHVPEAYKPKQGQIDLDTTYTRDFNSYEVQPVATVRPLERARVTSGKVDTIPTYKDDYRAWDIQRRELSKPQQTYHPPTVKFGNSTTFQDDYVPQETQPRQNFKPLSAVRPPTAPFHGDTSHRLDYVPHQLESKSARPKEAYRPPDQPFEGRTTHRCTYQGLLGESAKICKPAPSSVTRNAPFEGSTEFRESFRPWEVPPPAARKVPERVPPPGDRSPRSSSQLDSVPQRAARVVPIWPTSHRGNKRPFQGNSTTKEDFPAWGSCRRGLIKQQQQIPLSSGKFEGVSTSRSHYVPHELAPAESCKPLHAPFRSSSPFRDATTYSTEYAPKTREVCPAGYPSPPGYVYENTDSRGHRFYRWVTPTGRPCSPPVLSARRG